MANNYEGYLVKIGEGTNPYVFPLSMILFDSYKGKMNTQDLDPMRDVDGVLHRNALPHLVPNVDFTVRSCTNTVWDDIMSEIEARYVDALEHKIYVKCWLNDTRDYWEGYMYHPDFNPTLRKETEDGTELVYDDIPISLIAY